MDKLNKWVNFSRNWSILTQIPANITLTKKKNICLSHMFECEGFGLSDFTCFLYIGLEFPAL